MSARAYAPYSRFLVGAAARARDGSVFLGVNVENAAYPLGVCAEKSALTAAVTGGSGPGDVEAIAITASPCGGCRQWLVEMGIERVVYARAGGEVVVATPNSAGPSCCAGTRSSCETPGLRGRRRPAQRRQVHARQRALRRQGGDRLRQAADHPPADLRHRQRRRATSSCSSTCPASSGRSTPSPSACSAPSIARSTTSTPSCSCSTAASGSGRATASSPRGSSG